MNCRYMKYIFHPQTSDNDITGGICICYYCDFPTLFCQLIAMSFRNICQRLDKTCRLPRTSPSKQKEAFRYFKIQTSTNFIINMGIHIDICKLTRLTHIRHGHSPAKLSTTPSLSSEGLHRCNWALLVFSYPCYILHQEQIPP